MSESKPFDINGLRAYYKQNPVKFKLKFGAIDPFSLSDETTTEEINNIRFGVLQNTPKPALLNGLTPSVIIKKEEPVEVKPEVKDEESEELKKLGEELCTHGIQLKNPCVDCEKEEVKQEVVEPKKVTNKKKK